MEIKGWGQPREQETQNIQTADKLLRFFEKTKFFDLVENENGFAEWLDAIDFETFQKHLIRVNGLVRDIPMKDRKMDGDTVQIGSFVTGTSYLPPEASDKERLFQEYFDSAKHVDDRKDAALMTYLAIQMIHPFSDGNGRTGRILYTLLNAEGKSEVQIRQEISDLTLHEGESGPGREQFTTEVKGADAISQLVARELARDVLGDEIMDTHGKIYSGIQMGHVSLPRTLDVEPGMKKKAESIISEGGLGIISPRALVILEFLKRHGQLEKTIQSSRKLWAPEALTEDDLEKHLLRFDGEAFLNNLSSEDVEELIEINRSMKVDLVRKMIDIIQNPDKYTIQATGQHLKDLFYANPDSEAE